MKIQNLRNFQVDNYILATVGALLVAASSLKLIVPVILIVFTLVLGWRNVKRDAVVLSSPIMVFAIYQYMQLALRSESLAYYGDLSNVYLVMLCISIPYVNMLLTRPMNIETLEVSVFLGSWTTMIFWGFYQLIYDGGCRIQPFGINALFIPTTLLPLTYYFIALRFQEGRSNAVDGLTIGATLFCIASYTGSRMPLYTLAFALMCILGNLIYNQKIKGLVLILIPLGAGLFLGWIYGSVSGCNLFQKISDQLNTFSFSQRVSFIAFALVSLSTLFLSKKKTIFPEPVNFIALLFGVTILVISYSYADGGFMSVTQQSISDALADSKDHSTWTRWSFYLNSYNFLISGDWNWIIGNGSLAESGIVNQGLPKKYSFTHAHNQYFSWLIAGGVIGLCCGLLLGGRLWLHIISDLPSFIFLVLLGLPFLTNSPMYNAPVAAQVLFLMLTVQVISFLRHGKRKIL